MFYNCYVSHLSGPDYHTHLLSFIVNLRVNDDLLLGLTRTNHIVINQCFSFSCTAHIQV